MAIRIVRLGSPRLPGEGLRIGTVRWPPRSTNFSVCCCCEHEERCHRSVLRALLADAGAALA